MKKEAAIDDAVLGRAQTKQPSLLPRRTTAAKIALIYAAAGVVWILGSGWLLHYLVHDQSLEAGIELFKGWVYVAVTALMLGFALDRYFRAIRESGQRLQESGERYRALFDQAVDGIALMRTDGTDLKVNMAFARMHGYDSPAEMEHLQLKDLDTPASAPFAAERLRRLEEGEPLTFEAENYRKDGSTFPLSVTASRVEFGGRWFILSFHRDITALKQNEEIVRQSQERLSFALQASHTGAWSLNLQDGSATRTLIHAQVFGYPTTDGKWTMETFMGHVLPDDRERVRTCIQAGIAERSGWSFECRIRRTDDQVRWVFITGGFEQSGPEPRISGIIQDITERKRAEQTLREREERLQTLGDNIPGGAIYQLLSTPDGRSRYTYFSAGVERIFGFPAASVLADPAPFWALIVEEDRATIDAAQARSLRDLTLFDCEFRHRAITGEVRWVHACSKPRRLADGSTIWDGVVMDITGRKQAEAIRCESEGRLRLLLESSPVAMVFIGMDERIGLLNRRFTQIFGYDMADLPTLSDWWRQAYPDESYRAEVMAGWHAAVKRLSQTGRPDTPRERRVTCKDGTVRTVEFASIVLPEGVLVSLQDLTQRKQAESELVRTRNTLLEAQRIAHLGSFELVVSTLTTVWSEEEYRIYGLDPAGPSPTYDEMLDRCIHPADASLLRETFTKAVQSQSVYELDHRIVRPDGSVRWVHDLAFPYFDEHGELIRYVGTSLDITGQKQAAQALQESEARFRALVETTFDWMWEVDAQGRYTYVSPKIKDLLGYTSEEVLGKTPFDLMPDAEAQRVSALFLAIATKREPFSSLENTNRHKDGRLVVLETSGVPTFDAHGRFQGYRGMDRDVTARKQTEAALREGLLFRREAEKIGRIGAWKVNPASDFLYWTEGVYEIVEAPLDYKPGLAEGLLFYDESSIPALRQALQTALQEGKPFVMEAGVTTTSGRHLWTEVRGLGRVKEGEDAYVMGTFQDVTERKRLEDQFRQSQKLEAIGQLAGGVAHDFNNLLTSILMQSDLQEESPDLHPDIAEAFRDIKQAAERGASLTRQLLLFSRRQVMQPQQVDFNDLVNNLAKLLRRIVGEDIRLKLDLHSAPLWLHADPGMLDQVIMNFTVNARDAMPKGGSLTLATDAVSLDADQARQHMDAAPGHYARLTVTDTGCGIPPEIQPRIFEPFFTTKEVGKGTGLGLATVFGIVKQHRGWLTVHSTLGQGTTFRVYLPISQAPQPQAAVAAKPRPSGGSETILLVEDDPAVRSATRTIMQRQGYEVLVCEHGQAALAASRQHPGKIDLLLTDIVMPEGLYGRELAAQLLKERPGLKIIYMSGYSGELAGGELTLQPGQQFLQKPCSPDQLLTLIRQCLQS